MTNQQVNNIVILTSGSIRHTYFRMGLSLSQNINVQASFVESSPEDSSDPAPIVPEILTDPSNLHLVARHNTEYDYFGPFIKLSEDKSKPIFISRGEINIERNVEMITKLNPELIVTYGCSIIKEPLLKLFPNRIINVHLGLSPYYRGSGTNFHAMARGDFQCVGVTYMFMDAGIDTGPIIHQRRAEFLPFDNPHQIGNRLISQTVFDVDKLVRNFSRITVSPVNTTVKGLVFKRKDATPEVTATLYRLFESNAVIEYLKFRVEREEQFPIVEQSWLRDMV